ncbi:HlyD family secretion protein [Selenomonas bovis]|uniref:HlyD family secretion protein n=1 Tax=Selenomonas bovis TaxID=416586 RepID=UPI00068C864F|nr:efflux RND transporter periplasmic adaptor subunit [Selenomonas bovis]
MEVDITEKVKRVLKFGPLALVALAILCALGVWAYQHSQKGLTVYDAKVASTMVGVKAKADGTITELVVQDGDHVEAGDVIARVQVKITDEQIAQLAQNAELAKQNLAQVQRGQTVTVPQSAAPAPMPVPQSSGNSQAVANARARLNRMNELYEMGAISAVKRDQAAADLAAAEAAATPAPAVSAPAATRYQTMTQPANPEAVKQAELAVKQAEAALENAKQDAQATEIVAPVSGTVYLGDDIQEGVDLQAGATVASIGDASNIWVEARLSPNQKGKIRLGQFVSYTIEGKKYQGTVLDIVDPADAQPNTAASGSLPAASEEEDEAVQTSSISEDAGNVSGDETEDSKSGNTEGNAPDMSDGRLIVKVSLPKDMADTLRPGTDAVVRFSSAN